MRAALLSLLLVCCTPVPAADVPANALRHRATLIRTAHAEWGLDAPTATFAALAVIPILFLVQIAFIVSFGVLLDTFVVRSLLVPALSYDIGRAIWWPSRTLGGSRLR